MFETREFSFEFRELKDSLFEMIMLVIIFPLIVLFVFIWFYKYDIFLFIHNIFEKKIISDNQINIKQNLNNNFK